MARAGRVPTLRLAGILVLAGGLALAAGALLPARTSRPWELAAPILAVVAAVADAALCPRAGEVRAGRHVEGPLHLRRAATVTLGLQWAPSAGAGARPLWWTDGAPASVCGRAPAGRARIVPGRAFTAVYEIRPQRRGAVTWSGPRFTVGSPLGLWCTRVDAALVEERTVYPASPRLGAAGGSATNAGRPRPGTGGLEFDGVRPYLPGEDAHLMDWRATARWDQPVVRRLRPERGRRVVLVVDAGRRSSQVPDASGAAPARLDLLCDAAMGVARAALRAGDAVGAMVLGSAPAVVSPRQGPEALPALARLLADAQPAPGDPDLGRAVAVLLALPCEAIFWFGEAPDPREAAALLRYLPPLARRRTVAFLEVAPAVSDLEIAAGEGERADLLRAVWQEATHDRQAALRALLRKGIAARDVPPQRVAAAALASYARWAQRGAAV